MSRSRRDREEKLLEDLNKKVDDLEAKLDAMKEALTSIGSDSWQVKTV